MRAVVQRVSRARVTVADAIGKARIINDEISPETTGEIGLGLLVLLGVGANDTQADADYLAAKITGLRIFNDAIGRMNLAVSDVGGALLVVSQFTLYGDVRRGKRPSFDGAALPEPARELYEYFVENIRSTGLRCESGHFQEEMHVELTNEGPVTILLDSTKAF